MNEIHHKILSELHRILSFATSEELLSTSRSPGVTTHMKYAIKALAKERGLGPDQKRTAQSSKLKSSSKGDKGKESSKQLSRTFLPLNDETREMARKVLISSQRFAKKSDIVRFATSLDINLEISAKDNKKRAVNKFMASLEKVPQPRLTRVFRLLFSASERQTEGWMDVITNTR